MGNSLNLTFIKKKSRFDQCLAVTGGAGKSNLRVFRKKFIDLLDGTMVVFSGFPLLLL